MRPHLFVPMALTVLVASGCAAGASSQPDSAPKPAEAELALAVNTPTTVTGPAITVPSHLVLTLPMQQLPRGHWEGVTAMLINPKKPMGNKRITWCLRSVDAPVHCQTAVTDFLGKATLWVGTARDATLSATFDGDADGGSAASARYPIVVIP
jgi:hypothetical protein